MKSINDRLSTIVQTRLLVTFVFMAYSLVLLVGNKALGWEATLVGKTLELVGYLCLIFVAGKSVTDAWKTHKSGNSLPNGEKE